MNTKNLKVVYNNTKRKKDKYKINDSKRLCFVCTKEWSLIQDFIQVEAATIQLRGGLYMTYFITVLQSFYFFSFLNYEVHVKIIM